MLNTGNENVEILTEKENIDFKKRNDLKKALIGAGAVGVGLIGLSSVGNAASIFYRNESGTMTDLKNQTSSGGGSGVIGITIDNGDHIIASGIVGYVYIPYACTIRKWYLVSDTSGSIVVDVWKASGSIPTVANTITGSEKPTLSSAQINNDTSLTTWTINVSAGDVIGFNVDSANLVRRVTLTIGVDK